MIRSPIIDPVPAAAVVAMPGIEADNLLGFLALLGLLRAIETSRPSWRARASWRGPPWVAHLHVTGTADNTEIAEAAREGVEEIVQHFDDDNGRKNVDFSREDFGKYCKKNENDSIAASLAAALTAEYPEKRNGDGLYAAPLVMMFGQGWQNFLERLIALPRGDAPARHKRLKSPPDLRNANRITEALFAPWRRADDGDGFRWDPEDDQRYALRFGDPSAAGAAPTQHGANRLAAIGFLSFPCAPGHARLTAPGAIRDEEGLSFVWPIWTSPLSRSCIEALLADQSLLGKEPTVHKAWGVAAHYRARRIANGKFMNVTRGQPVTPA